MEEACGTKALGFMNFLVLVTAIILGIEDET